MLGSANGAMSNIIMTWPPIRSWLAGAAPLYGTCTMSTFAVSLKSSAAMWPELPTPCDAYVRSPFLALASATSSFTDFAGSAGCITSTFGAVPIRMTGLKSFTGSYGSFA